ncbi:MAG: ClbS/DfsB family four-helix bundle protein, partial [Actinomycetota bacterium]|nr:ClbS/DfsB family four-helix bundle protein [Actinomycetota bacterium]
MTTNEQSIEAYRGVQQRMTDLLDRMEPSQADLVVPATPDWRVRDLLAHVVGVTADVAAGRLDGAGSDPWTAVQVEQRQGRSIEELLE